MARTLLESGRSVVALTRADTPAAARARVLEALRVVGAGDYADRVNVVHGDICDGHVIAAAAGSCRGISRIVHCAGALEFREEFAELDQRVNVQGTANMLRLAETLQRSLLPLQHRLHRRAATGTGAGERDRRRAGIQQSL